MVPSKLEELKLDLSSCIYKSIRLDKPLTSEFKRVSINCKKYPLNTDKKTRVIKK